MAAASHVGGVERQISSGVAIRRVNEKKRETPSEGPSSVRVDLSKLESSALKRYRRHFKLVDVGPNPTKEQLLSAVGRHFMAQQPDEQQVIACFMKAAKRLKK
eukprot:TRINITY_DN1124_c0_g1_i1.p1 TRINITY_DN1124_c0_g1~~TRINITY_DN1124_c0_g1_i1.p1  ORF type:complete len:103 (-),score=19.97 TRINITY_DN1124_c0_g1_i1:259-567(-)